jgi:hypothetical protein
LYLGGEHECIGHIDRKRPDLAALPDRCLG